jgi:hypothetical protein
MLGFYWNALNGQTRVLFEERCRSNSLALQAEGC